MYYNTIIIYYDKNVVYATMPNLIRSGLGSVPLKEIVFFWKIWNLKFLIDQACSVNLAWYWTRSFLLLRVYKPRLHLGP